MNRICLLILLGAAACSQPGSKTETRPPAPSTVEVLPGEEDFNIFFEKFRQDSVFQVGRVKFPWLIPHEEGADTIYQTDWLHADFAYEPGYATRQADAYTQQVKRYGDTVKVEQRGVDNGIFIDFMFAKAEGKWFLVGEKDLSD